MQSSGISMRLGALSHVMVLPEPDQSEEEHYDTEDDSDDDFGRCARAV